MSKVVVNLDKQEENLTESANTPEFGGYQKPKKRSFFLKVLGVLAILAVLTVIVATVAGYFYWQYLKTTPQYSLALLIEAARNEDQEKIDELVDTDAVVDDFVPKVIEKAQEIYGRGIAPKVVKEILIAAAPIMPVVKQRARAELPNLLQERTKNFEKIPFWAMVIGAEKYLEIKRDGEFANIKSKVPNRPLEIKMKRNGEVWQVVALNDEKLAEQVAKKIGQEILSLTKNKSNEKLEELGKRIGIKNLGDLFKKFQDLIK